MDHVFSVCSGIGGLDLGFHAGMRRIGRTARTVCMVEREAFCCSVLGKAMQAKRLDQCPVWCGDLADVPTADLPRVDWYIGGYPCQPFSTAGAKRGENDRRHLWPVIERQLHSLRPRGVFFENVAGHVSLGLRDVLGDLERLGFRCAFGMYSAAEVGAPHRRDRVFILGLADSDVSGLKGDGESDGQPEEAGRSFRDDVGGRGPNVADPERERGRGGISLWEDAADAGESSGHPWPARPGEQPHGWEPARTVPSVRGSSDGIPNRVDRLRALGNAVVPQQAEHAFVRLWSLLT